LELSNRLREIAALVPRGKIVADIGTDHALLPVYLIERGITNKVIATDINRGPFESARQAVKAKGLQDMIDVRRGNGLDVLFPGEVQAVIIAGMGGNTIRQVLADCPAEVGLFERLILQPMNDACDLRRWLLENGWCLIDEKLVLEADRLYVIIVAEPCAGITPCESKPAFPYEILPEDLLLEIGPCLILKNDPNLSLLLRKLLHDYMVILEGLAKSQKTENKAKAQSVENKAAAIREVLGKWL
jgi:tRNA (adenine22-N1)-methyltransferase